MPVFDKRRGEYIDCIGTYKADRTTASRQYITYDRQQKEGNTEQVNLLAASSSGAGDVSLGAASELPVGRIDNIDVEGNVGITESGRWLQVPRGDTGTPTVGQEVQCDTKTIDSVVHHGYAKGVDSGGRGLIVAVETDYLYINLP